MYTQPVLDIEGLPGFAGFDARRLVVGAREHNIEAEAEVVAPESVSGHPTLF